MRSKNINLDGSGNGPVSDFYNRILNRLTELQFYDTATVRVEQTTRGTRFHAKAVASQSSGSVSIRGEYDPSATYNLNDFVVISMGINQGTFVCINGPVTGVAPYTGGGNWMTLPGGLLGTWF